MRLKSSTPTLKYLNQLVLVKCLFLFSLLFFSLPSISNPLVKFNQIKKQNNISITSVKNIQEDQSGIIWLLTYNGIVKYDGYQLSTYQSNNKRPTNKILSFALYDDFKLLLGTSDGLQIIDTKDDSMEKVELTLESGESLNNTPILNVLYTSQSIFLTTKDRILKLDLSKRELIEIFKLTDNTKSKKNSNAPTIFSTDHSIFLVTDDGFFQLNLSSNTLLRIESEQVSAKEITSVYQTHDKEILVGTVRGVWQLDDQDKTIKPYKTQLSDKSITNIIQDKENGLWIATKESGLFLIKASSEYRFVADPAIQKSLSDSNISTLYVSSTGTLWIGTRYLGLNWIDPTGFNFSHYNNTSQELSCLRSLVINMISFNEELGMLISTQDGLYRVDISRNICDEIPTSNNPIEQKKDKIVFHIYLDSNDTLWMGTGRGLLSYNLRTKNFTDWNAFFPNLVTFDILEDDSDNIFIAAIDGVYRLNKVAKSYRRLDFKEEQPIIAYKLLRADTNKVLVGTWQGLFTIKDNELVRVRAVVSEFETNPTRALFKDSHSNIWIGVDNVGLFKTDRDFNILESYKNKEELPDSLSIFGIRELGNGEMLFSSSNNLTKISKSGEVFNFYEQGGLQDKGFSPDSLELDNNGYVYAGGRDGLNFIHSSKIQPNLHTPKVSLQKFLYFKKEVPVGSSFGENKLTANVSHLDELVLSYKDNSFGFEFTGVHFGDPERVKFAYLLDGYDKNWILSDFKHRRANYTNLPAGEYIFKVKAANLHGIWSDSKEIKITILTPYWLTPAAYVGYIVLIFLCFYLLVVLRTRALVNKAEALENSIKERTKELAEEKSKVEQLLSKKNDEFTNVSHEFRTPLTLIIGPLNNFIKKYQNKFDTSELNVIERNSQRLLRMVNQMLNMEILKVEAITKRVPENFSQITEFSVKAFSPILKDKGIDISLEQENDICFDFTPDAYEKILLNLLSNAIKYTNTGGSIHVKTYRDNQGKFVLSVEDTGFGIAEDKQASIFERFSRVTDENSERITGAGIGLALVKDLVEAHDGSIELESELGKGTTIRVYLPIINEVDASTVELHQNKELIAMELMALTENQSADATSDLETKISQNGKPSVLVIEDNADMRHFIQSNIKQHYQVLVAKNGEEGVKIAESEIPDLIISDIMMPKMNGYEVTRALRQSQTTSHIPIILLTAKNDLESRIKGWQENADEYLTKPFSIDELLIRLKNLLDIRELLKKRFANIALTLTDNTTTEEQPTNQEEDQQAFIAHLNKVLDEVYQNSDTRVQDIAVNVSMSERQLNRKLKGLLDLSPNEYLRRYRLEKARELLIQGNPPNFTAFEVGFSSQSYFGRCFKAQYGVAPSELFQQVT